MVADDANPWVDLLHRLTARAEAHRSPIAVPPEDGQHRLARWSAAHRQACQLLVPQAQGFVPLINELCGLLARDDLYAGVWCWRAQPKTDRYWKIAQAGQSGLLDALFDEVEQDIWPDDNRLTPDPSTPLLLFPLRRFTDVRAMLGVALWRGQSLDPEEFASLKQLSQSLCDWWYREDRAERHASVYDMIRQNAAETFVYLDPDLKVRWANEAAAQYCGVPATEMRGQYCYEVWRGRDTPCEVCPVLETRRTGLPQQAEVRSRSGGYRLLRAHPVLDSSGNMIGITEFGIDITELKQNQLALQHSEARFRAIAEYSHNAIGILDEWGHLEYANRQLEELTGCSREQLLEVKSFHQFLAPSSEEHLLDLFGRFVRNEPYAHRTVGSIRRADQQERQVDIYLSDYADTTGARRLIVSLLDVTDLRRAEQEQERLQAGLIEAQKMESVGRLAGGVAHDFNNMLVVIIGYADLLSQRDDLPESVRAGLQEILGAARHSAELTKQLLAFARKQMAQPRVLDLNEKISTSVQMLQRLIGESVQLVWHPGESPWPVRLDPTQVDQILTNLCINARDAIQGAGVIWLTTENVMISPDEAAEFDIEAGPYVRLRVQDSGKGMDAETLAHLFEPFYTTKGVGQGTGLGLATVFGIVKQNRGHIIAESPPSGGALFTLWFPAHNVTPASDGIVQSHPFKGGTESILVVEDEPSVLAMTRLMLTHLGYRVVCVTNPSEALRLIDESSAIIDLVLTDIVMPGMNGRELAATLQRMRPGLKCLFMSGYPEHVIASQGVLQTDFPYITKPFQLDKLAVAVRHALDSPAVTVE